MLCTWEQGLSMELFFALGASLAALGTGSGCAWVCSRDARHRAQKAAWWGGSSPS